MNTLLNPIYENKKSYYNKAKIIFEDGKILLKSYSTIVAYIENNKAYVKGLYSHTTTRHIKEFLRQNNFKVVNSNQLLNDYGIKS